jgi:outer membrane murein-binding lipoprotein Lpp
MRAPAILAPLLLAGCQSEPDFDERYERANQEIRAKAEALERELEQRGKDKAGDPNS